MHLEDSFNNKKGILELKKNFLKEKKKIKDSFFENKSGLKVCKENSLQIDQLIKKLFKNIINKSAEKFSICAIGGYGREQIAPYSDLDILFIVENEAVKNSFKKVVSEILYNLWDFGFQIGHALRSISELILTAKKDLIIKTSILDLRFICGNKNLFDRAEKVSKKEFDLTFNKFMNDKIDERSYKLLKVSKRSFFLEPNIKESIGGLRDVNLIFWFFKSKFNTSDLDLLYIKKIISSLERKKLTKLLDFILTIRCCLHYTNNRAQERLTFDDQLKISKLLGYKSRKKTLGVERFMKHYYLQIRSCRNLSNIYLQHLISKKKVLPAVILKSNNTQCEEKFINIKNINKFLDEPTNLFKVFFDAFTLKLLLHPFLLRVLFNNLRFNSSKKFFNDEIFMMFKTMLIKSSDNKIFKLMNLTGVLSKIIPEFSRIIAQSQFDKYHIYTVDVHTLKALEIIKRIQFKENQDVNNKFVFDIFDQIKNITPLLFSVLLHDIGKGRSKKELKDGVYDTDLITKRMKFSKNEQEEIKWLVKNHQLLSEIAFKRDIEDIEIIKTLKSEIGSLERLRSLFILTVVDISAVSEGLWNSWKASILQNLFEKCQKLFVDNSINTNNNARIVEIKYQVSEYLNLNTLNELEEFSNECSFDYWIYQSPQTIASQIDTFFRGKKKLKKNNLLISHGSIPGVFEITIVTSDRKNLLLGIIANILKLKLLVLESRIFTLKNNNVIDTFKVMTKTELKFNHQDLENIKNRLIVKLNNFLEEDKIMIPKSNDEDIKTVFKKKLKVNINSSVSDNYNIIEVMTNDREFLLYDILTILIKNNVSILSAKISTNEDIVEDFFFIQDSKKNKISKNSLLSKIKKEIEFKVLRREKIVP